MDDLNDLRIRIDEVDREMIRLLEERMAVSIKIGNYKIANNLPVLDRRREKLVISKNLSFLKNMEFKDEAEFFINCMMELSKNAQKKLGTKAFNQKEYSGKMIKEGIAYKQKEVTVGFQGVLGSFSEQALHEYFSEEVKTKNLAEFEDVFQSLQNEEIDYGIIPIANSSTGGIAEVYDLLRRYGFFIIGERIIKVDHHLLGVKGARIEDITEVYSHSQGFQQCSEFFREYPDWKLIPYKNTAVSARMISEENNSEKAAVAGKRAAEIYNLEIIKEVINNNPQNFTRFIIISSTMGVTKKSNKISIMVSIPHKPGALHDVLSPFAENKLNMLKIESRPIAEKSWEYFFFIDFEGSLNDNNVVNAIEKIQENCNYFQLLGNYERHEI
ncbi:MAG: prephenate dehydratase [Eubacteriales bacterium]